MTNPPAEPKLHGNPIADTSIRQPVFITMMMLLAVVVGGLAYTYLPVNYLPDISVPTVSVSVSYPGADPQTMADQVAKPIEDAMTTVNGLTHLTTTANQGTVQISAQFDTSVVPNTALQNVRDTVNAIVPRLPSGVSAPSYRQFDPNDQPVLQLAVSSDGTISPVDLLTLMNNTVVPSVEQVQGVGQITVNGGQQRQINVLLNLSQLAALHIAPSQVSAAISSANTNIGLGAITSGKQSINLRAPTQITQPSDIATLPIAGTVYQVGDVATVQDGVADPSTYARLNGQPAVTLSILKESGSNTIAVAEGARQALQQYFATNPHLKYYITNDQSVQVRAAVDSSIEETIMAVLAAMLVVLLFFRNLRSTLVTIAGLPIIMIFTFGAMALFGMTVNIISLLALSLSVGLVIDDAIVVRENVFRFMERGDSPMVAASRGTAQVALSVLAMTLTIIAVFLPVTLVTGYTGSFFKAFGITAASAMAISLIEAFTFAPMLSAHAFKQKQSTGTVAAHASGSAEDGTLHEASEELGRLGRGYERLLAWTLRHRWAPITLTLVMLALSATVVRGIQITFLPAQASDNFAVGFTMPPGTSLDTTDQLARQAEQIIQADPDVVAVQANIGNGGTENGSITLRLKNTDVTDAVRARLRPKLTFLPGLVLSTANFQGGGGTGVTNRNVQLQVQSTLPVDQLAPLTDQMLKQAQAVPGLTDVSSSYTAGRPELQFHLRNDVAGVVSVTASELANSLQALVNGDTATTWLVNGQDVAIVVQLPPDVRANLDAINQISIPVSTGNVPLASLATIVPGSGPTSIRRYDRQNEIVIGANVAAGYDQNQLQTTLLNKLKALNLPSNVALSYGGQTQNQQQGFSALFAAMGLSVLLVYIVLASQFGSYSQPLVIMLAMPFSFLGAFIALRIVGKPLDITSLIGLIMLLGLVVKNSILMVDFTNRLRREGLDKHTAIQRASAIRLRPILMTSTAIVAGALPTALGLHIFAGSAGSEFRQGLADVLIGGLLTSTLLTLLVVPTAYSLLDSLTVWLGQLGHREQPQPQPALAFAGAGPVAVDGSTNGVYHESEAGVPAARVEPRDSDR